MIDFEYPEDKLFFERLLINGTKTRIENFQNYFDFRNPIEKRKEFNSKRKSVLNQLVERHGLNCMLRLGCCDMKSGTAIDHLIPLSTNKLNKQLRQVVPQIGRKVPSQSYGSNHIDNLIIACSNCNNHKKHKILDSEQMNEILKLKLKQTV